jgi:hypothetical protein
MGSVFCRFLAQLAIADACPFFVPLVLKSRVRYSLWRALNLGPAEIQVLQVSVYHHEFSIKLKVPIKYLEN